MMDFSLSESQEAYRAEVREFAEGTLDADVLTLDKNSEFNRSGWKSCAKFGIQGGPIPEEFGGQGLDVVTFVSGLEALGEVCLDSGLPFAICAHVLACELPILTYGTDAQKKRWLPALCSGEQIASIAIAEEQGASDAFNLLTMAVKQGDGYVLNGRKMYVTNSPFCDLALVFAKLEGSTDTIICLVVDKENPGMHRAGATEKMGFRTAPFGELVFKDCKVPEEDVLGKPSSGKLIFMSAMEWERGCLLAPIVGAMQRQVRECIARVAGRKQGEGTLSRHQAVSHRVVDMKVRTELARLILYKFLWKKQISRRANMEASMAKLFISEAAVQNALDALQVHGAYGYTCESGIERMLRDTLGTRIASGTSDIQRSIIAKWLRL